MAGQLLNKLKAGETKSASHEARLGIMVITILVFAFGFLVYHKMDLHQRRLTEVAIEPGTVAPPGTPPIDPAAALLSSSPQAAATDPLVNIGDLSDGSPFADTQMTLTEPLSEQQPGTDSFAGIHEPDSSEPAPTLPTGEIPAPEFAFDKLPEPESVAEAIPDFTVAASESGIRAAESPEEVQEVKPPAFAEIENQPAIPNGDEKLPSADYLTDGEMYFPAGTEGNLTSQVESAAATRDLQANSGEPRIEVAADEPSFPLIQPETDGTHADTELSSPSIEQTEAALEPVFLALAEPQQGNGFDNGFLADEGTAKAKAPLDDPAEFPSFEPDALETPPLIVAAEPKPQTGSKGFNAVVQPGRRSDRNAIRTAAGSGSDGKFSLAAFNYGNRVAPAAPDDGSTFDSVVVQNGDNYTKISKRVYGTVRYFSALAVFNQHRIPEPKNMRPGMVVLVPAREVLEERYPELFVDSQPKIVEQAGFLLLDDGAPAYRIGERETISEISKRFLGRSSRWIEIYRLNQSTLSDPNKLKAGTILALPADAVEVNVVP